MIHVLTDEVSLAGLFQILEETRVETVRDGLYEVFFTNLLPSRRLIYPCDYEIETELTTALEKTMQAVQDIGCYVDVLFEWEYMNRLGQTETTPSRYCYVSLDQLRYAIDENGIAEALFNQDDPFIFVDHWAMYSASKKWGMHIDGSGKYALLAGTVEFTSAFDLQYSSPANSVQEFLNYWKGECSCNENDLEAPWNWLTRLMIHVYGKTQAIDLMNQAHMFQ